MVTIREQLEMNRLVEIDGREIAMSTHRWESVLDEVREAIFCWGT